MWWYARFGDFSNSSFLVLAHFFFTALFTAGVDWPCDFYCIFSFCASLFVFSLKNEKSVENAVKLDGSEFKGRQLKVTHKRVNQPGFHFQQPQGAAAEDGGGRGGRGFGGRGFGGGRGRGRGGFRGGGGRGGRGGGGRGGFRGGGGRGGYHPYY